MSSILALNYFPPSQTNTAVNSLSLGSIFFAQSLEPPPPLSFYSPPERREPVARYRVTETRRYSRVREQNRAAKRALFARAKARLIQMCRGSSIFKARSRAEPTDDPAAPAAASVYKEWKRARRPLWILLLLVLLTSCRLIMALLSDPVPQRVPPSTEPRGQKVRHCDQPPG